MLTLLMMQPGEIAQTLAERARKLRLLRNLSQSGLAERSGVSLASLKRFERTGQISLDSLLRIAIVLEALEPVQTWFEPPPARSVAEVLLRQQVRRRGRQA